MGSISVNKLGGFSIIVGPIVALIGYFLQPGGMLIDAADPANAQASMVAITSNAGLSQVTGFLIAIGLVIFLYGLFVVQENLRGDGNGDALSRYGSLLFFVGILGWVTSTALSNTIAGSDLQVAGEAAAAGALYAATLGIGTTSGVMAGLGFLALALAISTRDDYNKVFALVAAVVAVVTVAVTLIGGIDSTQLQTLAPILGICFLIHLAWSITLGIGLINKG